jgi:hypothetical protein
MPAGWIAMSPVNDATAFVPFVLAEHFHNVAFSKRRYSRRKVDVVGNQRSQPWRHFNDESLMSGAFIVIGQDSSHAANGFQLHITALACDSVP